MRFVSTFLTVLALGSPVLAEELSPTHAKVAVMEKLVGTWTGPYIDAEGTAMEAKCVFSWTPTKYAILWTWTDWPKGLPDRVGGHGNGVIHWDPVSKKLKEYGVLADGTTVTTLFTVDGDRIVGERKIIDAKGQITVSRETWTVTDTKWNWASSEIRDESGNVVRKFPEGMLAREKQ